MWSIPSGQDIIPALEVSAEPGMAQAGNYLHTLLPNADGDMRQAIFGYNHSQAYVNDVFARARDYAHGVTMSDDTCASGIDAPTSAADVRAARRLIARASSEPCRPGRWPAAAHPRRSTPASTTTRSGFCVATNLRVTAAREPGHRTHGDGTAVDLVPADGITQPVWDASAGQLARDLGWTRSARAPAPGPPARWSPRSSSSPTTATSSHGSPRTCSARCPAYLHISWTSGCFGSGALAPPCEWVTAFNALEERSASPRAVSKP